MSASKRGRLPSFSSSTKKVATPRPRISLLKPFFSAVVVASCVGTSYLRTLLCRTKEAASVGSSGSRQKHVLYEDHSSVRDFDKNATVAHRPRVWPSNPSFESGLCRTFQCGASRSDRSYEHDLPIVIRVNNASSVRDSRKKCEFYAQWHRNQFSTCNTVHEIDFQSGLAQGGRHGTNELQINHLFHGLSRQAWQLKKTAMSPTGMDGNGNDTLVWQEYFDRPVIFKNLLFEKDYKEVMFEHQRVDAVATERLTSSSHVIQIYGFCGEDNIGFFCATANKDELTYLAGESSINEWGDGGDLERLFQNGAVDDIPSVQRLRYARDAALGLADIHSVDGENLTTLIHHDIRPPNFLLVNGTVKYHDFNNARFLKWDFAEDRSCGFKWSKECGITEDHTSTRAPEECISPGNTLTEKVETFRLGVFFFYLLTGSFPYRFEAGGLQDPNTVKDWVISGKKPSLPADVENSSDRAIKTIVDAMRSAMAPDVNKRPSTRQLAEEIAKAATAVLSL